MTATPPTSSGTNYGTHTEAKIAEVIGSARRYGNSSIIALAGVPGTGKSYVGRIASQRLAGAPERVLEVQFHPSSSYETFIEGMRVESDGSIVPFDGAFLEWNSYAEANDQETWVVLIDEFSRADISAVLGEVLTFIEDRTRAFTATYSRKPVRIASNLRVIVTYNPTDRSALEIDNALLRRLRVIDFPPDVGQLREMLGSRLPAPVAAKLEALFASVRAAHPTDFEQQMPFGHGIFSEVDNETPDLYELWIARIRHLLRRPLVQPHPFTGVIEAAYPWRDPMHSEVAPSSPPPSDEVSGSAGEGGAASEGGATEVQPPTEAPGAIEDGNPGVPSPARQSGEEQSDS